MTKKSNHSTPSSLSLSSLRSLEKLGINKHGRRQLIQKTEDVADTVTELLSIHPQVHDIFMKELWLGEDMIRNFEKQIGKKNFHQVDELFKAIETFFWFYYGLSLVFYIVNEKGDGELFFGSEYTHSRDIHLGKTPSENSKQISDYSMERRAMESMKFESTPFIEGDGWKGAIRISLPTGKSVILSFGDQETNYRDIFKIQQWLERGWFAQIIREKVEYIYEVFKDHLTGLYNRKYLDQLSLSKHNKYSVIYIDINNFKNVNDTHGHDIGDLVLIEIANILEGSVRKNDRVIRLGGDEFVLLIDTHDIDILRNISAGIRKKIEKNSVIWDFNARSQEKIGVAIGEVTLQKDVPLKELITKADRAMYVNKDNSKESWE